MLANLATYNQQIKIWGKYSNVKTKQLTCVNLPINTSQEISLETGTYLKPIEYVPLSRLKAGESVPITCSLPIPYGLAHPPPAYDYSLATDAF